MLGRYLKYYTLLYKLYINIIFCNIYKRFSNFKLKEKKLYSFAVSKNF